jgi:hypothetical protein
VEADGALLGLRGGAARRHAVPQEEPDAHLLAEQMELPEVAWAKLNWSWIGFFVFMGMRQSRSSRSIFRPTTGSTSSSSAASG